tara:strand:+ start:1026 stop:1538 length:513 start_codon:yes stop_codon:yes gene_type:complete
MGLIQVNKSVLSSASSAITITGINTDDTYMLTLKDIQPTTNVVYPSLRVTESGTANSTTNYDLAYKVMKSAVGFANYSNSNQDKFLIQSEQLGTVTQEKLNGIFYIYNANNSSEYTFMTFETTALDSNSNNLGIAGGGVFTSTSAVDGVSVIMSSGNVEAGAELVLYKVV